MSKENVSVIKQGYEAYGRGDIPAIFALLHPQIEIHQTEQLPWGGAYKGHDGAREFFQKLAQHVETRIEPTEFVEAGDHVVALGYIRGHVRANGQEFELRIVHNWTVKDGLITRFEAYIDTPGMLKVLRAGESASTIPN